MSYHKNNDFMKLHEKMKFFCIKPSLNSYNKIINNTKIKNIFDKELQYWKCACLYKYGTLWKLKDLQSNNEFINNIEQLRSKLLSNPTRNIVNIMWYVFFATGEYMYLEDLYCIAGNSNSNESLQNYAIDLYIKHKNEYFNKINKIIDKYSSNENTSDLLKQTTIILKNFDKLENKIINVQNNSNVLENKSNKNIQQSNNEIIKSMLNNLKKSESSISTNTNNTTDFDYLEDTDTSSDMEELENLFDNIAGQLI